MAHEQLSDSNRLVIEKRMGYCWVILPAHIAAQDYSKIEEEVEKHTTGKEDRVVFDFSNVTALYSSGIGILIRFQKRVAKGGGVIALVNVSPKITDLLISFNLDKVFPLYNTDVEFEISQEELWNKKCSEHKMDFLFIAQVEKNIYRLSLSGEMVTGHDMSACRKFLPDPKIQMFILDLTALSAMDSNGAGMFMHMLHRIVEPGGKCRAFGAIKAVKQVLQFLGAEQYITFYETENNALAGLFAP
jgi:anti-anti-sigma factor